jgi:hypothetical protein
MVEVVDLSSLLTGGLDDLDEDNRRIMRRLAAAIRLRFPEAARNELRMVVERLEFYQPPPFTPIHQYMDHYMGMFEEWAERHGYEVRWTQS